MTYLEIVNRVLRRLRENEVTTINETPYSKLIADLVNVVKREIEDAWDWSCLRTSITITTADDLFNYVLTNAGTRLRVFDVINDTDDFALEYRPTKWFDRVFQANDAQKGSPAYYNFNGVSPNGDTQIDLFPIPDGAYIVQVNIAMPQLDLDKDTDVLSIPNTIVIEGVLARAISERGDDGGYMEQEQRYRQIMSDYIAIEAGHRPDETLWRGI